MPRGDGVPAPMLARLAEAPFDSPHHLFEVKWDGYRCLLLARGSRPPRLVSRGGRDLALQFPALAAELPRHLPEGTLLDGEIVAVEDGRPRIDRLRRRQEPILYVAFDCLRRGHADLMARPLIRRREILAEVVCPSRRLVRSEGVVGEGRAFFAAVAARDLEGMMAKALDAPYLPGVRSSAWLKVLNYREGVFPLAGWEAGPPWRPVEALWVVADPGQGTLTRVSGIGPQDGQALRRHLPAPPSSGPAMLPLRALGVPDLGVRVRYRERLPGGGLRHPVYRGWVRGPR
jgi:ATP-dependent DNA ligase